MFICSMLLLNSWTLRCSCINVFTDNRRLWKGNFGRLWLESHCLGSFWLAVDWLTGLQTEYYSRKTLLVNDFFFLYNILQDQLHLYTYIFNITTGQLSHFTYFSLSFHCYTKSLTKKDPRHYIQWRNVVRFWRKVLLHNWSFVASRL